MAISPGIQLFFVIFSLARHFAYPKEASDDDDETEFSADGMKLPMSLRPNVIWAEEESLDLIASRLTVWQTSF